MLDTRPMSTLKTYLADTGESQSAFARRAGLSKQHVSLLVTEQRKPQDAAKHKIFKATRGRVTIYRRRRKRLSPRAFENGGGK